jgi:hypothetical protein
MARIVVMLGLALVVACSGGSSGGGKLKWQRDPNKAMEHARFTGKPMLIYFTSDG